jgi:predicted Fe-S protein YdhL (DUF1289 family)
MTDVTSPCIRCCCLDDDNICLGCHRTLEEITAWGSADNERRRAISEAAAARAQQRRAVMMMRES